MAHINVWNPKKYHPKYCEMLLESFIEGSTIAQFCREIGVGDSCFYKWLDKYPEFKLTYEKAKTFKRAFHESELKANLENQDINIGVYKYYMRMVVGVEDTDKPQVTVNNNQVDPELVEEIKAFREKFKSEY